MHGFVDESMRRAPGGLYVLAAVLVPVSQLEACRESARSVLLRRQRRFRWRDETEPQRRKMLAVMVEAGVMMLACACTCTCTCACACRVPPRQQRARALCATRLAWEASRRGVGRLVFESREERNCAHDRLTMMRAVKARACPASLVYGFARPADEPLLWLADAAAGAVAAQLAGEESGYRDQLGDVVVEVATVGPWTRTCPGSRRPAVNPGTTSGSVRQPALPSSAPGTVTSSPIDGRRT